MGALVRIKQICNHPAHFAGDGSALLKEGEHRSGKVKRAFEILEQAQREGRKALIFTQFPTFGTMLLPELERIFGQPIPMLHGGVPRKKRADMVRQFQLPGEQGPPAMVLSVRAGGTGITLTEASVVVHIDRWWNPAVEDQATDRAYRIGQNRDVTVYKLVAEGPWMKESMTSSRVSANSPAGSLVLVKAGSQTLGMTSSRSFGACGRRRERREGRRMKRSRQWHLRVARK